MTPLMPWSLGGAFYSVALGVTVLDYLPWAFFNYLNVFVSIGLAMMGFGIFRLATNSGEPEKKIS